MRPGAMSIAARRGLRPWLLAVVLVPALTAALPTGAEAQLVEPVLERYVLGHGGTSTNGNVNAFIEDDSFGGGTAEASTFFDSGADADYLYLRVWRHVPRDTIVFALLVFRVEVRGYDPGGTLVHTRNLEGFSFGDSASGSWLRKLRVPHHVARWEITYIGNYE